MNGAEYISARSSVISKLQSFQRLADGLEWFLSPLRLPVPPSRLASCAEEKSSLIQGIELCNLGIRGLVS
jgi:hypothetical protein